MKFTNVVNARCITNIAQILLKKIIFEDFRRLEEGRRAHNCFNGWGKFVAKQTLSLNLLTDADSSKNTMNKYFYGGVLKFVVCWWGPKKNCVAGMSNIYIYIYIYI